MKDLLLQTPHNLLPNPPKINAPTQKKQQAFLNFTATTHLKTSLILTPLSIPALIPSSAAAEQVTDQLVSDKITIESILIAIDDFFNHYPFFVAGCTAIWLIVIPLTEEFLNKCKAISAIDAFRKLSELPNAQLLDIRKESSINYMSSPNLKVLNKNVVQEEFAEGQKEEERFVKEVVDRFGDPKNTVLCVLDNFDGNSMKVAEMLFKNAGFKEVYAIKGGLRGKDGWQAIQEMFLPLSVHVYPHKRKKQSKLSEDQGDKTNGSVDVKDNGNGRAAALSSSSSIEPEVSNNSSSPKPIERPLSLYPKYPDLKPPSSPTPSKPKS